MDSPTARGAITIRTADGVPVGHGWGEVRARRDPERGFNGTTGEVRDMVWSDQMPPRPPDGTYRVDFYGGLSFLGVFDAAFPDTSQRRASFHPSGLAHSPRRSGMF